MNISLVKQFATEIKEHLFNSPLERTSKGSIQASSLSISNPNHWILDALPSSITGKNITPNTSLQIATVFSAVRLLSETIASLPLFVYERQDNGGRAPARGHFLFPRLHDLPNEETTALNLRETIMANLLLRGNAYCEKVFDRGGRIRELWLLKSENVEPFRDPPENGRIFYRINENGRTRVLPKSRIWHIAGLGFDGITGMNPIKYARETLGLAMAQEEFGAHSFQSGARFTGVLTHPGQLGNETRKELEESFNKRWGGIQSAGGVPVLEEGMTFKEVSMSNEDAEFLKSRQFSVQEIARIFRVPLHMLYFSETQPRANMEQASLEFVKYSLRPWLVRIEQSIFRDLIPPEQRSEIFAEHNVEGLLRGDFESRMTGYQIAKFAGWMNADEIRAKENMNPIPDGQGQVYWRPSNHVPVGEETENV